MELDGFLANDLLLRLRRSIILHAVLAVLGREEWK